MFRRLKLSQDNITVLDIHTTSPGQPDPPDENLTAKAQVREPKIDLYIRANQFYLRSRLSRLRRGSSSIV